MKRVGGWFGAKAPGPAAGSLMTASEEPHALADAMASAILMMDDELELAESELSKGTSPFHKLGRAYALFFRAVLGFEKDVMAQASARLAEAEECAAEYQRRAIRDPSTAHHSAIYPVGAEFALCHAEAQLMSAVVAVLNENLTESLRGFYKLKKAFWTLHEINEAEKKYLDARRQSNKSSFTSSPAGSATTVSENSTSSSTRLSASQDSHGVYTPPTEDDDDEFVDANEDLADAEPASSLPDLATLQVQDPLLHRSKQADAGRPVHSTTAAGKTEGQDLDFSTVTTDPIDLYIHSGTAMVFGLLQLILSMIPPAFSRILSLFSFRGDREAGLRMLWSATQFKQDMNGAMAGLVTLGFHNAAIGYCDILAKDALPEKRLKALLVDMRELYPKSKLWLLEEARMLAANRQLEKAIEVINQDSKASLRQVEALRLFERSLNFGFLHRYEECAAGFIQCVELNSWSHGLYYYIAGACYVELYRTHRTSNPTKAEEYAAKADLYMHKVPDHTGKKRFMARQLPFDTFVLRKMTKWDHRAKTWKCKFVDAVGVSPMEEMAYFWSGYRRMDPSQLQDSLAQLAWFDDPISNVYFAQEAADEKAILALLRGTCLRFLGEISQAKSMLQDNVLSHQLQQLKACSHPDTWPLPVAHYEMAVCFWEEAGREDGDKALLRRCSEEIAKVTSWESFDLEARIGLKVTTARDTLRKIGM